MNVTPHESPLWRYEDISVGAAAAHEYVVSRDVYERFTELFGDRSPIHADHAYARSHGYPGILMHGAVLNGFISNFVGMHFPGRLSLELGVDLRFVEPVYLEDVIRLEATVAQKLDVRRVLVLDAKFQNVTRAQLAARARIQVLLREI